MAIGIGSVIGDIDQKVDAYRNNPEALMRLYQQNPQLIDLLALQKLKTEKESAIRDMQMKAQTPNATVKDQREQQVLAMTRNEVAGQVAPGLQMLAQQQQQAQQQGQAPQQQGQAPQQGPSPGGLPTLPAPNMQNIGMAGGGIVAFQEGQAVPEAVDANSSRGEDVQDPYEIVDTDENGNPITRANYERMHAANELSAAQRVVAQGGKDETKGGLALRPPEKKLGIASLRAEAEGDLGSQGSAIPTPAPAAIPTPARTQETPIEELLRLKKFMLDLGTGKGFFGGNAGASTAAFGTSRRIAQLEKQMGGAGGADYAAAMQHPELIDRGSGIADYYNQLASERQAAADKKNATKAPTEAETKVKEDITKIPTNAIKQAPPAVQDEYAKRIAELKAKESDKNDRLISFLLGAAGHSSLAGTLAGGAHAGRARDAQIKQQIMDTQDKITALNLKQQELGIESHKVDVQALGVDAENAKTRQVAQTAVLANDAKLRELAVQAGYKLNELGVEGLNKFAEAITKVILESPTVMSQMQAINKQEADGKMQPTDALAARQSIMNTAMEQALVARTRAMGGTDSNPFMRPSSTSIRPDNK